MQLCCFLCNISASDFLQREWTHRYSKNSTTGKLIKLKALYGFRHCADFLFILCNFGRGSCECMEFPKIMMAIWNCFSDRHCNKGSLHLLSNKNAHMMKLFIDYLRLMKGLCAKTVIGSTVSFAKLPGNSKSNFNNSYIYHCAG